MRLLTGCKFFLIVTLNALRRALPAGWESRGEEILSSFPGAGLLVSSKSGPEPVVRGPVPLLGTVHP